MSSSCTACLDAGALRSPTEDRDARWAGVVSLSLGVFALVTAEFLPASLLTAISTDLRVTDGANVSVIVSTALYPTDGTSSEELIRQLHRADRFRTLDLGGTVTTERVDRGRLER